MTEQPKDQPDIDATTKKAQEGQNLATGEGNGGHDADDANTRADAVERDGDDAK